MLVTQLTSLTVALYPDGIPAPPPGAGENPDAYTGADIPTLEVFLPDEKKSNGSAILIFPGGSYSELSYEDEGTNIAALFVEQGITAFVVKYRLPVGYRLPEDEGPMSGDRYMVPLQDAQQ